MLALTALLLATQTFDPQVEITGGVVSTFRLEASDFNDDGVLDLLALDGHRRRIDIALGRGDGSFVSFAGALQFPDQAMAIEVADLDADGVPELVIYDLLGGLWVARRGVDGFYSKSTVTQLVFVGLLGRVGIDAGDVDGDGDLDLLVGSNGDAPENLRTVLIENFGALEFASPVRVATQIIRGGPAAFGDLNGDTLLDTIVVDGENLLTCRGTGTFTTALATPLASDVGRVISINAVDFDLDGDVDVVFKNDRGRTFLVSNLGFSFFAPKVLLSDVGNNSHPLLLADFNDDGAPGYLDLGPGMDDATLRLNTAGFIQQGPVLAPLGGVVQINDGAVGDFNSDGVLDVALAAFDDRIAIYLGQQGPYGVGPSPDSIVMDNRFDEVLDPLASEGFGLGDFDGDGDTDVAGIDGRTSTLRVFENRGTRRPVPSVVESPVPTGISSAAAGDFDGDGLSDLVFEVSSPDPPTGRRSALVRSTGGNAFGAVVELGFRATSTPILQVGDVNGDGADDIVGYTFGGPGRLLEVAFGGPGTAIEDDPVPIFPVGMTGPRARFYTLGDVNGDGRSDLILPDPDDASTLLIRFGGPAGFDPAASLSVTTGSGMFPVAVGDVDGSGLRCIVLRFDGDDGIYCVDQFLPGVFGPVRPLIELNGSGTGAGALADYDGDGLLDIGLLLTKSQGPLVSALNRGTPINWEVAPHGDGDGVSGVARPADLDGDGDLDIVVVGEGIGIRWNRTIGAGSPFCAGAVLNSRSRAGRLELANPVGSAAELNAVHVLGLPPATFAIVVTSRELVAPLTIPNSVGRLCLGGTIGRFLGPGQVLLTDILGNASLLVDPAQLPQGGQITAALPGDSWHFQAWYRDIDPTGSSSSNLTNATTITWR